MAPMGMVTIQARHMSRIMRRFRAAKPPARPTPSTAPTSVWVVETGRPRRDAKSTVKAAANSAEKPRLGVSSVIFLPIVSITRQPQVARPSTMPVPPSTKIQG